MNKGLSIFKRAQHLQGGEGSVNDPYHYDVMPPAGFNEWLDSHQYNPQTNAVNPNLFYGYGDPSGSGGSGSYPPSGYTPPINIPFVPPADYNFTSPPMSDQQMINNLGYDPGDPRNDLTRGFGSGVPTQRGIGTAANIAGNMVFPGLGMATGPAASWVTRWLQGLFGQNKVQNATQPYQQGQQTQSNGGTGSGTTDVTVGDTQDVTGTSPTTPTTPKNAGVGIDPTGNPAQPGQWWSPDFGRWTGYDQYGTTPGSYNLTGPGGGMGQRGTGFGAGTVGNLATAIGWEGLGGGGGHVNPNAWGGTRNEAGTARGGQTFASHQLNQIGKGIFSNDPNPEGIGALYEMTGTQAPSAGQFQQDQQQLQNILQANPSLMSGPTSGPMLRGGSRIPLQTVQQGASDIQQNPGLRLFMAGRGLRKPKKKKQI